MTELVLTEHRAGLTLSVHATKVAGTGGSAPEGEERMSAVLQWSGAVVVLAAFGLSQWGKWGVLSYRYLVANFVGGFALSAAALLAHQWGFVLLEGIWGMVAGRSLALRLGGRWLHPAP